MLEYIYLIILLLSLYLLCLKSLEPNQFGIFNASITAVVDETSLVVYYRFTTVKPLWLRTSYSVLSLYLIHQVSL
jgi:hypothetical protein